MNQRVIPPGYRAVPTRGGGQALVAMPQRNIVPSGVAYQRAHALQGLGQHPTEGAQAGIHESEHYPGYTEIPAFYTVSILLGGEDDATQAGATTIRPEPFVCRRITWCTSGDAPVFITIASVVGSAQGRVVEATWSDEFTKFLGNQPCLISALFGDSQGFLDFPQKGVLFQGRQTLQVDLHRLIWPDPESEPAITRFDFNFQGVALLPLGINQSGSAG